MEGVQSSDETELNALKERVKTLSSEKTALPVEERLVLSI